MRKNITHFDLEEYPEECAKFTRAADLLERLSPPQPIPALPEGTQVIEPAEHTLLVPIAQPIPVSERLPGPGDFDEEEQCWWFCPEWDEWFLYPGRPSCRHTHWLPAHALPVPEQEASK